MEAEEFQEKAEKEVRDPLSCKKAESEGGSFAEIQSASSQSQVLGPAVHTEAEIEQERYQGTHCPNDGAAEQLSLHARKSSGSAFPAPFSPIRDDEGSDYYRFFFFI